MTTKKTITYIDNYTLKRLLNALNIICEYSDVPDRHSFYSDMCKKEFKEINKQAKFIRSFLK